MKEPEIEIISPLKPWLSFQKFTAILSVVSVARQLLLSTRAFLSPQRVSLTKPAGARGDGQSFTALSGQRSVFTAAQRASARAAAEKEH